MPAALGEGRAAALFHQKPDTLDSICTEALLSQSGHKAKGDLCHHSGPATGVEELATQEEEAQQNAEVELVQCMLEAGAARAAESPPWDENNEELDYYDDVDQDTEMVSSQEAMPMTRQESNDTTPASSQDSMSQESSMPSLESVGGTTILDAAGGIPMEDEACLDGPTIRCTPDEERALLNPLLIRSFDHLEDVSLGCLDVLVAHINEIHKVKVSQTPVPLPRAPTGLPPLQPISIPMVSGTTVLLSEAIYSAASNLGTSLPHHNQRMPTHPPDQAKTDLGMRVLEGINTAPETMLDHSEPWSTP